MSGADLESRFVVFNAGRSGNYRAAANKTIAHRARGKARKINVREMKEMLAKYPDDMELIVDRCSDYTSILESKWSMERIVKTVEDYLPYGYVRDIGSEWQTIKTALLNH